MYQHIDKLTPPTPIVGHSLSKRISWEQVQTTEIEIFPCNASLHSTASVLLICSQCCCPFGSGRDQKPVSTGQGPTQPWQKMRGNIVPMKSNSKWEGGIPMINIEKYDDGSTQEFVSGCQPWHPSSGNVRFMYFLPPILKHTSNNGLTSHLILKLVNYRAWNPSVKWLTWLVITLAFIMHWH